MGGQTIANIDRVRERFWVKVKKTSGCWEWTASLNQHGYGNLPSRIGAAGKNELLSHRVSWIINIGPIPDGADVLHQCDNPKCVRPDHLFLGTHAENMKDMKNKGRHGSVRTKEYFQRGSVHYAYRVRGKKITKEIASEILAMRGSQASIGNQYGVSQSMVSKIKCGKGWHLA